MEYMEGTGVGNAHLTNQVSDVSGNSWPTRATPRLPTPKRLEGLPVPPHDRVRPDDDY